MKDLRLQISEAALEALRLGQDDDSRVIEVFREMVPGQISLPSSPTPSDLAHIRKLIGLTADKVVVIHGDETPGFASTLAIGVTSNEKSFGCTGILISPDIVLTAAHCIADGFTGGLWLKDLSGRHFLPPLANGSKMHESFGDPVEFANDIGMIRLSQLVTGVEIYRIADSKTIDKATIFRIVGFGQDENHASSIDIKKTSNVTIRLNPSDGTIGFKNLEFVIGNPLVADDADACDGDSGGPVFVEVGGDTRLAGLISRGVNPPVCGDGTICLRLDRYVGWIDKQIETLGGQKRLS